MQAGEGDTAGVGLGSLSGNVCAAGWKAGIERCVCSLSEKTDFYPWRKQEYVTETEDYIARVKGNRTYPWRILAITEKDTEMPVNNLVYALASPNRIGDCSWVKPGKVAWGLVE